MLKASIVIATKNRKNELRRCLASCLAQQPPVEVLLIDDGSTDGTATMVAEEFPSVRLVRHEVSEGYIAQRNRGAQLAVGDLIFSLDDDAVLSSPDIVRVTIGEFQHPRVGAVAIPRKEIINGIASCDLDRAPDQHAIYACCSYVGCGHAVRRDLFLRLGGYQEFFHYSGEEIGFCVRLLNAGYIVRLGNASAVLHYPSLVRNRTKQIYHNARSTVLLKWSFVPWFWLPWQLAGTIVNSLVQGVLREGYLLSRAKGLCVGLIDCAREYHGRNPVSFPIYKLFRELGRRKAMPLEVIACRLRWTDPP